MSIRDIFVNWICNVVCCGSSADASAPDASVRPSVAKVPRNLEIMS